MADRDGNGRAEIEEDDASGASVTRCTPAASASATNRARPGRPTRWANTPLGSTTVTATPRGAAATAVDSAGLSPPTIASGTQRDPPRPFGGELVEARPRRAGGVDHLVGTDRGDVGHVEPPAEAQLDPRPIDLPAQPPEQGGHLRIDLGGLHQAPAELGRQRRRA